MTKVTLWQRLNTAGYPLKKVKIARNRQASALPDATTFYLRYTEDGVRKKEPVGSDLLEALNRMKIVQARLAAKAAGIETSVFAPPLNPHAALAKRPLTELSKEYEARIADKKYKTRIGYMNAVNRFLGFMGTATLGDCDRDAMIRFRQHLAKALKSDSYRFNTFLKVVMFLNDVGRKKVFQEDDWLQPKDWPVNVDKKENGTKRYDTYTRDEIAALLSVADTRERALVLFLVSTGFRISEARDATWALVDFGTNVSLVKEWRKAIRVPKSEWKPKFDSLRRKARRLARKHREWIERVAKLLMEKRTLTDKEIPQL
jgi:integrase